MTDVPTRPGSGAPATGGAEPAPRHLVELPDRRKVAVDVRGPADGPAVLLLHPAPGSRVFDPDPEATAAAGVRLITLDRPGYGRSGPRLLKFVPTLAAVAADLAWVLRRLDVGPVAVAGWGDGGPVALALAEKYPELVRSVALLAAPAPDDDVPWLPGGWRDVLHDLRGRPKDALPAVLSLLEMEGVPPVERAMATLCGGAADERALAEDPALAGRLREMLAEALRPGVAGMAADLVAATVPATTTDPSKVRVPVQLFYGDADETVAPQHGRYWERTLPDARLHVVPGAGHLVVARCWAQVLADLTSG